MHGFAHVDITAGQNHAAYSILVPDSNSAYTLDYRPAGYCSERYSANGSCFIDVREGDQTNINLTLSHGKVISGTISLPIGVTAPSGGLTVSVCSYCDNGTPDNQTDDLQGNANVNIPEGQSQAVYSVRVPDTDKGYNVYAIANGYPVTYYESQGNCFAYVSNGNAEGINIAFQTNTEIYGDCNNDGYVDALDFLVLKQSLMDQKHTYNKLLDLNVDNTVDSLDFAVMKQYLLGTIKTLPYKQ